MFLIVEVITPPLYNASCNRYYPQTILIVALLRPWIITAHGIGIATMLNVNNILLCTHNPISVKNIYGILRDEGFVVETADHPALAVRMVLEQSYSAVIIDAQPFGLSVGDATKIIKTVSPETTVILVGCNDDDPDGLGISTPMDLSELKNLVHNVKKVSKISNS
jgi:CheY-like chemotaxis protein